MSVQEPVTSLVPKDEDIGQEVQRIETIQFVTFYFGEHFFGLPIEEVIEINRMLDITPVPLAPDYVAGVVNLRGQILTAINLAARIGLSKKEKKEANNFNNLIMGRREEPISLLVEQIGDVMAVAKDYIEPPPALIDGLDVKYVKHVCKLPEKLLIILDSEALQKPKQNRLQRETTEKESA